LRFTPVTNFPQLSNPERPVWEKTSVDASVPPYGLRRGGGRN
jgi:hypothetical protein